jgi:Zn-dependent protease
MEIGKRMKKPAVVRPTDDVTKIGEAFGTPVVVKGVTWFPLMELFVWVFTTWWAGKRGPERSFWQRACIGALTMPVIVGSEWCHNFAHAAAARLVGKPMDVLRITWGTPLVVYYDIHDPTVTPRQHIVRALGGPLFNALLLPALYPIRKATSPTSIGREIADAAIGMNTFLCTVALLPLPMIDGGPILKWSLVERGHQPQEADEVVKKVDGVLGGILGIASGIAFKKKRPALGILLALFAAAAIGIASGLLREE